MVSRVIAFGVVFRGFTNCEAGTFDSIFYAVPHSAMTGHKGESAVMLFVVLLQFLKLCGTLRNFVSFPKELPLAVVSSFPKALPLG